MGTYGFLRFNLPLFPQAALRFAPWIALLAVAGARGRVPIQTRYTVGRQGLLPRVRLLLPLGRYAHSDSQAFECARSLLRPEYARLLRHGIGDFGLGRHTSGLRPHRIGFRAGDHEGSLVSMALEG